MANSIAFVDIEGTVVGLLYRETYVYSVGEETAMEIPYELDRPIPPSHLTIDSETLEIRECTLEEAEFKALLVESKEIRDEAIYSPMVYGGKTFLLREQDVSLIDTALAEAAAQGYPDTIEQPWVLADGSIYTITLGELKGLSSARALRMQTIFALFTQWVNSSPTDVFTFTDTNVYGG